MYPFVEDAIKAASICSRQYPTVASEDEWLAQSIAQSLRHSKRVSSADKFNALQPEALNQLRAAGRAKAAELVISKMETATQPTKSR